MATAEALSSSRSRGKTPHTPATPSHKNGHGLTRRQAIPIIAAGGIALGLLKPWESLTAPETLESLVAQAKKMENEYKDKDLSNKPIREKYAGLLAGIFNNVS